MVLGKAHFPVEAATAAQFACVCKEFGTFRVYLSHVKSACELLGVPTEWAESGVVAKAKRGILKSNFVFNGPKCSVDRDTIVRIANVSREWESERFFVIFSWVFC